MSLIPASIDLTTLTDVTYLLCRQAQQIWFCNLSDDQLQAVYPIHTAAANVKMPQVSEWVAWPEHLFTDQQSIRLMMYSDQYGIYEYAVALDAVATTGTVLYQENTLITAHSQVSRYLGSQYSMRYVTTDDWPSFCEYRDAMYEKLQHDFGPTERQFILHCNDLLYQNDLGDTSIHANCCGSDEYLSYAIGLLDAMQMNPDASPDHLLLTLLRRAFNDPHGTEGFFADLPEDCSIQLNQIAAMYWRKLADQSSVERLTQSSALDG